MPDQFPIAVFVSGSGSNLQALIDVADAPFTIVCVVSDNENARGLVRAASSGIPTSVVAWGDHPNRESFTDAVCAVAEVAGARALVLAGFMRILAPSAIARFPNAILNVHPSLLPAFPGVNAVEQALDDGIGITGVTVHFVDEQVDHGPIVAQEPVPILASDTPESLHMRIQEAEHRLLPHVVGAFARGEITVDNEVVAWRRDGTDRIAGVAI
ncbi:MAG: phosphoribosylglycinamide formyltransferase [Acidimicrobiia bacterium]